MDPLSVAASVTGTLGAAAKSASVLKSFIQNTKSAPKSAQRALTEVTGTSAILTELQAFVVGSVGVSRARGTLILVEQVLVTLTQCVITILRARGSTSKLRDWPADGIAGPDEVGRTRVKDS